MTIQHLTPSDYITTKWSGGLTTQLGIAPASAVYADRDFLWRLSSATVEDAESDLRPCPTMSASFRHLRARSSSITTAAKS